MNWNITDQKQHTWKISNAREISRLCFKKQELLEICLIRAAEQNDNNRTEESDSSYFYQYIWILRIERLRSEAESSAGDKQMFNVSLKFIDSYDSS